MANQRQIIVKQFGFTPLQTTLLGCVDGVVESMSRYLQVLFLWTFLLTDVVVQSSLSGLVSPLHRVDRLDVVMQPCWCSSRLCLDLSSSTHFHPRIKSASYFLIGLRVRFLRCTLMWGLSDSDYTAVFTFVPFVILLGWVGSIVSGHTKSKLKM